MCVAGSRNMSVSRAEVSRSRVLSQMIGSANHQLSLRLPCGYLEAWLAFVRCPLKSGSQIRSVHASVAMLNVRCACCWSCCAPAYSSSVFKILCTVFQAGYSLQRNKHRTHATCDKHSGVLPLHLTYENTLSAAWSTNLVQLMAQVHSPTIGREPCFPACNEQPWRHLYKIPSGYMVQAFNSLSL